MAYETTAAAASTMNPWVIGAAAIFDTVRASAQETTTQKGKKVSQVNLSAEGFNDLLKQVIGTDKGLEKFIGSGTPAADIFTKALAQHAGGQYNILTAPVISEATSQTKSKRSVICSELVRQGQLHPIIYLAGADHFAAMPERTVNGYYSWGVPAVKLMQASKVLTAIAAYIARSRYLYIITKEFNLVGWFTVKVGEPFCYMIGRK